MAKEKKKNPWIEHVKVTKAANPELKFKDVLKKASTTFKKK